MSCESCCIDVPVVLFSLVVVVCCSFFGLLFLCLSAVVFGVCGCMEPITVGFARQQSRDNRLCLLWLAPAALRGSGCRRCCSTCWRCRGGHGVIAGRPLRTLMRATSQKFNAPHSGTLDTARQCHASPAV